MWSVDYMTTNLFFFSENNFHPMSIWPSFQNKNCFEFIFQDSRTYKSPTEEHTFFRHWKVTRKLKKVDSFLCLWTNSILPFVLFSKEDTTFNFKLLLEILANHILSNTFERLFSFFDLKKATKSNKSSKTHFYRNTYMCQFQWATWLTLCMHILKCTSLKVFIVPTR